MQSNVIGPQLLNRPPLDEKMYSLNAETFAFFKLQTGIRNDDELKSHILSVLTKTYEFYGYPCLRCFAFTKLGISRSPAYEQVLKLRRGRKAAILLDLGCCLGTDVRKAVTDGWPIQYVIASDIQKGFWDYGHELFKSTPATFPAVFIAGDAFDPKHIAPREPFYEQPENPRPILQTLSSLTPLQGHVSAIHVSDLFHVFDEGKQLELARQVATLLSPMSGSIIFGSHIGRAETEKGFKKTEAQELNMFCHSPNSWEDLWNGEVFKKGSVYVDVKLIGVERPGIKLSSSNPVLTWSVIRL